MTRPDAPLREALAAFGLEPAESVLAEVHAYTELLLRWNRKVSLTSIREPREIWERHFGECMYAAAAVPIVRGSLVDVGSGAGFPGLALKLIVAELKVTLVEPNLKKSAFLSEVSRALKLQNVSVLSKRIEELGNLAAAADFVTCRAVRIEKKLLAWCHSALKPGGKLVLWVGQEDARKLQEAKEWSWREPVPLPLSSNRVLLIGVPRMA